MYECLWCKAFHSSKDIKEWEKRDCFICKKELVKRDPLSSLLDMFNIKK